MRVPSGITSHSLVVRRQRNLRYQDLTEVVILLRLILWTIFPVFCDLAVMDLRRKLLSFCDTFFLFFLILSIHLSTETWQNYLQTDSFLIKRDRLIIIYLHLKKGTHRRPDRVR